MIVCPSCKSPTSVRETRSTGNYLRRRRICDNISCNKRVTTIEAIVSGQHGGDVVIISMRDLEGVARAIGLDRLVALSNGTADLGDDD